MKRNAVPHAFVFTLPAATVTTLLAANRHEGVRLGDLQIPLITAMVLAGLAWFLAGRFVRERTARSLVAALTSTLPLVSGYLFAPLRGLSAPPGVAAVAELTLLTVLALVAVRGIQVAANREGIARFLDVFGLLVLALAGPALVAATGEPDVRMDDPTVLPDAGGVDRPDIYLIVLDAYTGAASLSRTYGFDNGRFLEQLAERGFRLPDTARSNYVKTFLSIGSMLNRRYFERLDPEGATADVSRDAYHQRLELNRTALDLRRLGYAFHYVGSSYPPLAMNRLADNQYSTGHSREFQKVYFRSTVLLPLMQICAITGSCQPAELPFQPETAEDTDRRIAFLHSLIETPGPKFVYAHWLLPHGPYRYDRDCGAIPSRWTVGTERIEDDSLARALYVDQLVCTNKKILAFIDALGERSTRPSIVILQADHGNGRFPGEVPVSLVYTTPDQVTERFDVFAAYSGPDGIADSLAVQQTPVNVMRALFRVLWDVDEPPLPDRYFWSEGDEPLNLVELTERQIAVSTSP